MGGGSLKTGDVCAVDGRGWFQVTDRKKELIEGKRFQVVPAALEQALLGNEHVADAAGDGYMM